jgi:hypothetical protein
MSNTPTEADSIGWDYSQADIEKEERERTGKFTEFELMLKYHEMNEHEWRDCSNNDQRQLWWIFRKLGKKKL